MSPAQTVPKGSSLIWVHIDCNTCVDPESFVGGGGPTVTFLVLFFLVDEGREDPNTTISGPSSACQQNAI